MSSLRKNAVSGIVWTYGQQFSVQIISFIISIILTRLLLPAEYGIIGLLAIFIAVGTALSNGGLASSLIRTPNLTPKDYSTVFVFNLAGSVLIYIILYFAAPYIAEFYKVPVLVSVTRVYCLSFIFSAFGAVQNTLLTKEMKFKQLTFINLPAMILSSILGVALAFYNFGVWSLVYMYLAKSLITAVMLHILSPYKVSFIFDKEIFKKHFAFGSKIAASSIIDSVFGNFYLMIIGKMYSPVQVGYYSRSDSLMMLPVANISIALNSVVFPLFSKVQHETLRLKQMYRKILLMILFIITPMMLIMIVLAKPIVIVLFSVKWVEIVPIFQILCLTGILYPIHSYNLIILEVTGKSGLYLKVSVLKKILMVGVILATLPFGFYALLWGQVGYSVLSLFINMFFAGELINYKMIRQFLDILPIFAYGFLMYIGIYFLEKTVSDWNNFSQILVVSCVGLVIYLVVSKLSKSESLNTIIELIKERKLN